jgi:hypothetical protein
MASPPFRVVDAACARARDQSLCERAQGKADLWLVCFWRRQRELKRMIKRARTMNLIPYKSKLPQFQKSENPFLDS